MILIWTSDGGPLQYIAMAVLILVQVFPNWKSNLQDGFSHMNASADANALSTATATTTTTTTAETAVTGLALIFLVFFGIGTAIVIFNISRLRTWMNRPRPRPYENENAHLALYGFAGGVLLPFLWVLSRNQNVSLTDIYLLLVSLVQVGGFVWMLQQFLGSNNNNGHHPNSAAAAAKMARIVPRIHAMPIEEFVANDAEAYDSLSLARLQQMLRNRGEAVVDQNSSPSSSSNAASPVVDQRSQLVAALMKCRKYSDSCCICYEEYASGGSGSEETTFLRVWPNCHHEFHLECLDQWAYTFRNKAVELPTCPLCKESL
eukprot:scaffold9951_cov146-Cylindrotheca_fusiformis.AAC.7